MTDVLIRPFQPHDQDIVRDLILAGLGEHFQVLDPALNTDLEDIQGNYVERGSTFLIAVEGDKLIGTGALDQGSARNRAYRALECRPHPPAARHCPSTGSGAHFHGPQVELHENSRRN